MQDPPLILNESAMFYVLPRGMRWKASERYKTVSELFEVIYSIPSYAIDNWHDWQSVTLSYKLHYEDVDEDTPLEWRVFGE